MSRRKIYRILIEAVILSVLIFLLVFFVGFRVTKVQVEGNKFYTDGEIKKMVLDAPIAQNSILAMLIKTEEKTKDAELIDRVTLKRKNRNTLVVQVKEKQMIGYFKAGGKCINFDRQGVIRIITEKPVKDVPLIDGLDAKDVKQGEKLKGINTRKLNTLLSVGKMLEKTEDKPDRLVFNDMRQLVLYYGNIEVRLGNDENMDEKMNRLVGILPELKDMEGILHLENITENTAAVVFDNAAAPKKDDSEEDSAAEGDEEDYSEDSDGSYDEDYSGDSDGSYEEDYSEESEGSYDENYSGDSEGSYEEDYSRDSGEGYEEDYSGDSDRNDQADSDLEYSDGSDAADTVRSSGE